MAGIQLSFSRLFYRCFAFKFGKTRFRPYPFIFESHVSDGSGRHDSHKRKVETVCVVGTARENEPLLRVLQVIFLKFLVSSACQPQSFNSLRVKFAKVDMILFQESFRLSVLLSKCGQDCVDEKHIVFVMEDFDAADFKALEADGHRILGPAIIFERCQQKVVCIFNIQKIILG